MRSDASNERPPPTEGEFRNFLTQLLKVPKAEIDRRAALSRSLVIKLRSEPC